jgi:dihydroorotase-like cyclic amidohydrolase
MPNHKPFISTVEAFKQKLEMIKKKAYVDWLWISCSHCER